MFLSGIHDFKRYKLDSRLNRFGNDKNGLLQVARMEEQREIRTRDA